ncbi:hypothetical protein BV913_09240 [Neisseria dumasiana]|uniref:Uncharacterized protein n=1 Tax=Neisseria dumasiana TaxID=1931275 RepID=A0ABX3WLA4_9NEIS|nr:hypothetical protein BV913_09240 [Neisseria dumasiana]
MVWIIAGYGARRRIISDGLFGCSLNSKHKIAGNWFEMAAVKTVNETKRHKKPHYASVKPFGAETVA